MAEFHRRLTLAAINDVHAERKQLESEHGRVWNTSELCRDFQVISFCAPVCSAIRRADRVRGSLFFQHNPRFYWGFKSDG